MPKRANSSLTIHPDPERLRHQNRQLQHEPARLVVERDYLKTSAAPQIAAEYECRIGALELRVFQYECDADALLRRLEMANAALDGGETPSYREIENAIENEFAEWKTQIAARVSETKEARELADAPFLSDGASRTTNLTNGRLKFMMLETFTQATFRKPGTRSSPDFSTPAKRFPRTSSARNGAIRGSNQTSRFFARLSFSEKFAENRRNRILI